MHAPERVRGMVVDMPMLDNALLGCAIAFTPLMVALSFGEPVMRLVARGAPGPLGRRPAARRSRPGHGPPGPGAQRGVLHGLFFGRTAPHKTLRRTLAAPAPVIGHQRDPVHPFSDSDALVAELPDAAARAGQLDP